MRESKMETLRQETPTTAKERDLWLIEGLPNPDFMRRLIADVKRLEAERDRLRGIVIGARDKTKLVMDVLNRANPDWEHIHD